MQIQQVINGILPPQNATLYSIINDLIQDSAPLVVDNRNYVVNNVPADLQIETSSTIVSSVLSKIFQTSFRHAQNSVILISAKVYGMAVLVQVKSKGNIIPGLSEDIGHASRKAQRTGGTIEMIHCESKQASIAYCFLNVAGAA